MPRKQPLQRYREKSHAQALYENGDLRERIAELEAQRVEAYRLALSFIGSPLTSTKLHQLLNALECRDLLRKERQK